MPNTDCRTICEQGRELRARLGTLTGHAIGGAPPLTLPDPRTVERVLDDETHDYEDPPTKPILNVTDDEAGAEPTRGRLPGPLASVIAYLGDDLHNRRFIPTAELIEALDVEPTAFGREMSALGSTPRRGRIPGDDGTPRQVRGYYTANLRDAAEQHRGA